MGYGGASIAFIAVYGAINGALALVPIFPYVGGGGFLPLCVVFEAIGPLILGPIGGILAAVIGGVIGMFISPATYPLGPVDVLLTGILPALYVALIINADDNRYYILSLIAMIVTSVYGIIWPYIWPGVAGEVWSIEFMLAGLIFWLPWLIIELTPIGKSKIPEWARMEDPKTRYLGVLLAVLMGLEFWFIPWGNVYWYIFDYSVALAIGTFIAYSWWVPTLSVITTIIAVAVVESLKRSGLPRIPRAIW
ncbi:hypothetical protein EU538_12030 [Candidatus Thorarchaeota archaeon]|nr:MAG: hypothetical protein EU538_12030 [Candidatus Thorarchaeota archaeon]